MAGGVTALQLMVVPVLVVFEDERPVGALGDAEHEAVPVVTLRPVLWEPVPNESVAATVNVYVVEAVRPVTLNDVVVDVPIEVPFWKTV